MYCCITYDIISLFLLYCTVLYYILLNYEAGADLSLNTYNKSYCTIFQDHVSVYYIISTTCKSPSSHPFLDVM